MSEITDTVAEAAASQVPIVGAATDVGRLRTANEDGYLALEPVYVVVDGMGGHTSGRLAARTALERISALAGAIISDAAQVIEAINQALEKARKAPTVKAYANGINTSNEWDRDGKPDGWEVRGSLVLEGTDTAAVARLAGELASTLQLDGVSYQLSTARRQAEENNLIQQAADAFRARAQATATAFGYKGYEIKKFRLDSNHRSDSDSIGAYAVLASRSIESDRQRPSVPGEGGDTTITLTVRGTIELR